MYAEINLAERRWSPFVLVFPDDSAHHTQSCWPQSDEYHTEQACPMRPPPTRSPIQRESWTLTVLKCSPSNKMCLLCPGKWGAPVGVGAQAHPCLPGITRQSQWSWFSRCEGNTPWSQWLPAGPNSQAALDNCSHTLRIGLSSGKRFL